ncbi:hypothetical protein BGX29_003741 [Mortierella sp. GBA35]|nr:hypothetical protein BGX29_003741 [Mortierella sp. GBA35]
MTDGTQSFRRGADNKVENIDVFYDPETSQQVVYWDDIQLLHEPRHIQHHPGVVLKVVEDENTTTQVTSHLDIVRPMSVKPEATQPFFPVERVSPFPAEFSAVESTDLQLGIESLALHETSTASSTSAATAVSTSTDRHALASPSSTSRRLLLRTQSMLQESSAQLVQHENAIRAGQIVQADAIKQGIQTMVDIRGDILVLRSEVAKNDELRELRQ